MSQTGRVTEVEARAVAEAARETDWAKPSFAKELYLGRLRLDLIHPHPRRTAGGRGRQARRSCTGCARTARRSTVG